MTNKKTPQKDIKGSLNSDLMYSNKEERIQEAWKEFLEKRRLALIEYGKKKTEIENEK